MTPRRHSLSLERLVQAASRPGRGRLDVEQSDGMYPLSKTALALIPKLVLRQGRERMLQLFEDKARAARSTQIGANHVFEVILETAYYRHFGEGLQGGPGSGMRDLPRDVSAEWAAALYAEDVP
jgi:hypothetical protein